MENSGTFLIPENNFAKFEAELAKLNKKSLKLTGQEIPHVVFGYEMKEFEINGSKQFIKCFNVLLTAEAPKINGWLFVARIDHANKEVGNIVHVVPGQHLDPTYRNRASVCDHCNVNRFRRDTFVVQNEETGATKQVGRTCLKDFLGHENPEVVAKRAEFLGYAAALGGSYNYTKPGDAYVPYWNVGNMLEHFAVVARHQGYVSRKVAEARDIESTSSIAFTHMHKYSAKSPMQIEEQDVQLVEQAMEWACSLGDDGREISDYEHNIKTLALSGYATLRSINYVMSIIPAWSRATGNLFAKGQGNTPRYVSQYVGSKGDKIEFTGTLTRQTSFEGQFGISYRFALRDQTGNEFSWFTGKGLDIPDGATVKVRGTVKDHDLYNNVQRTTLTRCKIETA